MIIFTVNTNFLIFSGILLLLALIYFISTKTKSVKAVIGVFVFVVCCVFGTSNSFAFWEENLTYEGESVCNYLQVKEDKDSVILSTNVLFGVQSIKKDNTLTGMYYDYAMAASLMADVREKDSLEVLILGMGTGTFATQCDRYFENLSVEGSTNRELFASGNSQMLAVLNENILKTSNKELTGLMKSVAGQLEPYEGGKYIMTDDKAPVA